MAVVDVAEDSTRQELGGRIIAFAVRDGVRRDVDDHVVRRIVERPRRHDGPRSALGDPVVRPREVGSPKNRPRAHLDLLPDVARDVLHVLAADGGPRAVRRVRLDVERDDGGRIGERVGDRDLTAVRVLSHGRLRDDGDREGVQRGASRDSGHQSFHFRVPFLGGLFLCE